MILHDDFSDVGGDELDRNSCADKPMTAGPNQDIRRHVDSEQIGRFIRGMFTYADPETYLSFRAFEERTPDAKPVFNSSILVGHERLIEEVVRLAQRAADHDRPTVVCPPLATFKEAGTARSSDLANGLVLSVECDVAPAEARCDLEAILGPATFVVKSGGIWPDPATGELVDKLHLHWRLSEPTRDTADHAALREARGLAARLVGADLSNVPPVHPIRLPGTWHRKGEPRMACIIVETENEIELADALERLREVAEARGIDAEAAVDRSHQPVEHGVLGSVPPSRVKAALRFIGGWDDRKRWIDVGIYVKAALGDPGYDLWAEWSAQSQKFDDVEARATWATFSPTRTGGGQLFQMAEAAGWRWTPKDDGLTIDLQTILESFQARQHQRRMEAEQAEAAAAGSAAANDDAPEPLEESDSPGSTAAGDALPEPVGLVREIRDHILATARSPQPELALAAALTIVGSAMARRYRFENLRSNLYLVGVAPSTSGKEVPLQAVSRTLNDAGLGKALAGGEPKSGTAVLSRLAEHPIAVYVLDEFGMLLRALTEKNAPKHVREIVKYMTEIFTKADDSYRTGDYADRKTTPVQTIIEPHLSIFGLTNSAHLGKSITTESVADGSLGRFLLFNSRVVFPDVNFEPKPKQTPLKIIEKLKGIHEHGGAPDAGNLAGVLLMTPASTREVKATCEAQQLFADAEIRQLGLKREHAGDGMSAIYGRLVENAKKLAMIHAVGRDPVQATVTAADAHWGLELAGQLVADLVKMIGAHVAVNEREATSKRVLDLIAAAGKKGITQSELTNKTQWLKRQERYEILEDLRTGGLAIFEVVQTNGRPRNVWRSLAV